MWVYVCVCVLYVCVYVCAWVCVCVYVSSADVFVDEDERGEDEECPHRIPGRVNTQPRYYVYFKKVLSERIEHAAGLASRCGSRASFENVMARALLLMDILDADLKSLIPEKERGSQKRFVPSHLQHKQGASKRRKTVYITLRANTALMCFLIGSVP